MPQFTDTLAYYLKWPDGKPFELSADKKLYRKQLIRVGKYKKGDTVFDITREMLKHWETTFSMMHNNGIKVAVPIEHTDDVEKNRGWVENIGIEENGDVMYGDFDFLGKEPPVCGVSISSPVNFIDGKGIEYKRPIMHVALTNSPVIPGLGDFQKLAASLIPETEETDMKAIALALGLSETATEEEIIAKIKEIKANQKSAETEKKVEASLKKEIDPLMMSLVRENRKAKLDQLIALSRITPITKEKIEKMFVSMEDEVLNLSITAEGNALFDSLVLALKDNNPVELVEKTNAQLVELSLKKSEVSGVEQDAIDRAEKAKK